jgi:hypothetical protein
LETFVTFTEKLMRYFETRLLIEADEFNAELDAKTARKVF